MNLFQGVRRVGRSKRDGFAGQFIRDIAAAASVAVGHQAARSNHGHQPAGGARSPARSTSAASSTPPAGQDWRITITTVPRRRTVTAPSMLPHTVQLCIHCRRRPAGFWVSRNSDQTARRPWCLSCCQGLDQGRYDKIPFDN
jgi:hypothetical protein